LKKENYSYQITLLPVAVSPLISFSMIEQFFTKLGTHVMAREPTSEQHFINASHQPVCLHVYPPVVARQQLGKTHKEIEELLKESPSTRFVSYQRKIRDRFSQGILALR
jgi:hypothetical protein